VTPYYQDDLVTIYHGDCREVVAPWMKRDLAIVTDPPYGMDNDGDTTRFTGGEYGIHRRGMGKVRPAIIGDNEPFDPTPWLGYPFVVMFGANHFGQRLPVGTTLIWLKRPDHLFGTFLSDAEIAWRKGGHGIYAYRHDWAGFSRIATDGESVHQNQKPVALMRWCIERSGAPLTATILDPFMGSGSTLVAAKSLGRKAIGVEIEERYCEIAARRCSQEVLGLVG
jgi:DNA modification methylase